MLSTVEQTSRMRAAETRRRKTATTALPPRHVLYIYMHTPFSPTAGRQELNSGSDARGYGHFPLCWRVTCLISHMCHNKKVMTKTEIALFSHVSTDLWYSIVHLLGKCCASPEGRSTVDSWTVQEHHCLVHQPLTTDSRASNTTYMFSRGFR